MMSILRIRRLHVMGGPLGSKKDLKDLQKLHRRKAEEAHQRREASNPFKRNVGIGNTLKYMQLSPNDPNFEYNRAFEGPEEEELERLGDEVSSKRMKSVDKQYKQLKSKGEIKHIMEIKKLFPRGRDPSLLTWIEKETIRHLHKVDPNTWTRQVLSESFPSADNFVIKKVLRSRISVPPERIREHDEEVAANWKRLQRNSLPIRPDLKEHILQNNSGSFKQPNAGLLPKDVTNEVIAAYRERFQPPPSKIKKGPFGSIISEYRNRLNSLEKREQIHKEDETSITLNNLFKKDQVLFDEGNINEPSPYRDTALLDTSINLRKEPHMTADEFKEVYFKSRANKEEIQVALKTETNPQRRAFFQWLHEECSKSDTESQSVEKVDVDEILSEIK